MIKRLFLFLPLLLAMSFSSTSQVSPKRGLAYGFTSIADINVLKPGISWWYNWSSIPDKGEVNDYYSTLGLEYVPMAWNGNIDVNAFISTIKPGAKYILGFNEPSLQVEANMTPQDAVNNWGKIEQIAAAKNLQIVSAAAIYSGAGSVGGYTNPVDWHKEFFRLCPNCWVDYIAFHSYEPSAGGVIGLTNNLKVFGRPIWVTEFANYNASVADNTSFMQQIVSAFENDPDIFRYSWFTGRRQGVPNIDILGANGVLTSLGTAYAGADYKQKMIAVPGRITANKHYRRNATALESTTDGGTGQSVGFTKVGSWGEYQLNVANTGSYNLNLRVASTTASNSVDIYVNGVFAQNKTFGTTNGWQTWADVLVSGITLPKGEVYLKLVYKSLFNLNYIDAIYGGGAIAIADFSATPNPTCVGNKVVFTNLTTAFAGDELYTWDFGQGASPATASATGMGSYTVTYSTPGQKTITLTAKNSKGTDVETKTNYITIAPPVTGCVFSDDFDNNTVKWITPIPGAFSHAEAGTTWTISNNGYDQWENFTYKFNNGTTETPISFECVTNKPILKVKAKGSVAGTGVLTATFIDAGGRAVDNYDKVVFELTTDYQTFTVDFARMFKNTYGASPGVVDSSRIAGIVFAINPAYVSFPVTVGTKKYTTAYAGTVSIDWIGVGDNCNAPTSTLTPTISGFTPSCVAPGTSVTITGTNFTSNSAVKFNGVAATITNVTSTQIVVTAPAGISAGTITVTEGANTATSSVAYKLIPVTSAVSGPSPVCVASTGKIYSVTGTSGSTYGWTVPAGATITSNTGNSITVTFGTVTGAQTISVIETNAGCSGVAKTLPVTVNALPTTSAIVGSLTPACNAASIAYSVTSTTGSTYAWTVPTGASILTGAGTASITVKFGTTNGAVSVVETNSTGCAGTKVSANITLSGCGLDANFSADKVNICAGSSVVFTNISTGTTGSTTYAWNFGANATPATASTAGPHTVTYAVTGSKTVTLTVTDGVTNTETKTAYISVDALITANAGADKGVTASSTIMAGNTPSSGTGTWTLVSGTGTIVSKNSATTQITNMSNGQNKFAWTIVNGACTSIADEVIITVSGVTAIGNPDLETESYDFFPNPFKGSATVKVNSKIDSKISLKVIDMTGIICYSSEQYETNEDITIGEGLASGVYTVVVIYGDTFKTFKVIKID